MHETYRMLGREREVEFEREARKRDRVLAARPDHTVSTVGWARRLLPRLPIRTFTLEVWRLRSRARRALS